MLTEVPIRVGAYTPGYDPPGTISVQFNAVVEVADTDPGQIVRFVSIDVTSARVVVEEAVEPQAEV